MRGNPTWDLLVPDIATITETPPHPSKSPVNLSAGLTEEA